MKRVVLKFDKPYIFEGVEYKELDMTSYNDLTGKQLFEAEQRYTSVRQSPIGMEHTFAFACALGAIALSKPIEFFSNLPIAEATAFKNYSICFLQGTTTALEVEEQSEEQQ